MFLSCFSAGERVACSGRFTASCEPSRDFGTSEKTKKREKEKGRERDRVPAGEAFPGRHSAGEAFPGYPTADRSGFDLNCLLFTLHDFPFPQKQTVYFFSLWGYSLGLNLV